MTMRIRVISPPDEGKSRDIPTSGYVMVGYGDHADLQVARLHVNRLHFRVWHAGGAGSPLLLEDMWSTNGTSINGVAVPRDTNVPLAAGDEIVAGTSRFVIEESPNP
jgi:pSer/pThr/pTyr-binding forkhead associated (FHA) protein